MADLGTGVLYRNRDGREMHAIVTATPDTADRPSAEGTVTLTVFSPNSGPYLKHDVSPGDGPGTFTAPKE